jgi:hypothetical protein
VKRVILYLSFIAVIQTGCNDIELNQTSVNGPSKKILVDASHDGGVWWYPQGGSYSANLPHQGKALADLLRSRGFTVDELPSYTLITDSILGQYDKVIRTGNYGNYPLSELQAYDHLLNRASSLFLISEFQQPAQVDQLAERLGINFRGAYYGNVDSFSVHTITQGATPFYFNAGSAVSNTGTNPNIMVLGWLSHNSNLPVMGILNHPLSKIFFLGEINGIELLPQPLTNNIIHWLFE